jgi:GNAT superfamily N-acetyltransferase
LSGQGILVRPARPEDKGAFIAILRDTFDSTWRPQVTPEAAARFRADDPPTDYVSERGLAFWAAERDGEVVGLVDWEGDFVHALHVRRDHARAGVGRALMDVAEAGITAAGHPAARLETDTFNAVSQAFYRSRGYVEADRYPDTQWDSGLTTLLLVKPLR